MSKINQIRTLVSNGLYYLTEHAYSEAIWDEFEIYDVENGILTGKIRRVWSAENKCEIVGMALDGRAIGIVCRITRAGKLRVITVYEDKPRK